MTRPLDHSRGWEALLNTGESNPGDGGDDQPPLSHAWGGSLVTNILQEAWPEDQITETVVLSLGEAILFFGRHSRNEGLSYSRASAAEFGMRGLLNWARKLAQMEASMKTMQDGCHVMTEAVVKRKMKASGPG